MPIKSTKNNKSKPIKNDSQTKTYLDKISLEVQASQSKLSMVLGALIILVTAILLFNYFGKGKGALGPAQNTEMQQEQQTTQDQGGKYTVKEDDTLFLIAQKYYNDGFKYTELAKNNNLTNPDALEVGQVLNVPILTETKTNQQIPGTEVSNQQPDAQITTENTEWGPKITGDKYTVAEGDWLSKIAGRAYGDVMAYEKIAQVNNITNPNVIEPGTVINLSR